ncbi:MAG TPA: hypothetical protein VGD94_18705 [Vicinamibacterales bacterium]
MSNFLSRTAPLLALLTLAFPGGVSSQGLPSEPIRLFDGQLRLGGEITVTFGEKDDDAFFNYTDYERNTLRTIRLAASGIWQPASRLAFLGEVRTDDFEQFGAYAAYVRVRPWRDIPFDVQAGRIPPVFGAFGRRVYQSDQILIGYPLAYQYLTSIRPDSLPATADDLLQMRGRGWLSNFSLGGSGPEPGLPLISAFRWDTGAQAQLSTTSADIAVAVTTGTLSNPRFDDDNGGKQVVGRLAVRPVTGLEIGGSAARGAWISDDVPVIKGSRAQTALGADLEYSRDYWLVRSELVWSSWDVPFLEVPPEGSRVSALGAWVEGRYRLTPRLDIAARLDRLTFSRITGAFFGRDEWDAPVTRFEFGGGYSLQRNLVLRAVVQTNQRDGGRIKKRTFVSGQVAWWF